MSIRSATPADVGALADLQRRWDLAWLGAVENGEQEVADALARTGPLDRQSRIALDGDRVVAAGWWWGHDSTLLIDPGADVARLRAELLDWFAGTEVEHLPVLSTDVDLRADLEARGWRHDHSAFELIRAVSPDWVLDEPRWPAGVELRALRPDDAEAVHRLIYVDAAWSQVAGHPERSFQEWRLVLFSAEEPPDQQVLAWRGDRLVGAATGRVFSDGAGWIGQLAVAADERGRGLGRALLLEGLRRRRSAGATSLGLGVQAGNEAALALYVGVGLTVVREWLFYVR